MNNKIKEYFRELEQTNKISHSFIIGNTSLECIKEDLEEVISKYFFRTKIDLNNESDIYIIQPEGALITKDQILDMQRKISKTSLNHNTKLYIIDQCEKLNNYASNSLLKILEEPNKNIYAFLITSNIDNVISTIKSRCQVLFISSENNVKKELTINIEIVEKFIELLEEKREKTIAHSAFIQKFNREEMSEIFQNMLYIYRNSLKYVNKKSEYSIEEEIIKVIINRNTINQITNKMLIINDIITNLNYNLNMNLLLDKFIIDFGGVTNEKNC